MTVVKHLAVVVLVGLAFTFPGTPAGAKDDPRVVRATVKVEKNRLTVFAAAARARAVKLCEKHPGSQRAKITVIAKTGIGYVYGYRCVEVLADPVGPTLP